MHRLPPISMETRRRGGKETDWFGFNWRKKKKTAHIIIIFLQHILLLKSQPVQPVVARITLWNRAQTSGWNLEYNHSFCLKGVSWVGSGIWSGFQGVGDGGMDRCSTAIDEDWGRVAFKSSHFHYAAASISQLRRNQSIKIQSLSSAITNQIYDGESKHQLDACFSRDKNEGGWGRRGENREVAPKDW